MAKKVTEQDPEAPETAKEETAPCACVGVIKAFAALPLEQRVAVHKAIDAAVAFDKDRAGQGLESSTELYEKAIETLNQ